jgi:hypothetical protein
MRNSIEALCSDASSSSVDARVPAYVNDEESRFEDHLGVELGRAPRAKVAEEPDSREARSPKEEGEPPAENDAPRDEADWKKYKLPRPELLLATVAGEHTSPVHVARPVGEPSVAALSPAAALPTGESLSAVPKGSESASTQPNQGGQRGVSPEPAMSRALPQPDSGKRVSSVESASHEMGDPSPRSTPEHTITPTKPLEASTQKGAGFSANATKGPQPSAAPRGDTSDSVVEAPSVVSNAAANLERAPEASPRSAVEQAVENPRVEMRDQQAFAAPSAARGTPKMVNASAEMRDPQVVAAPSAARGTPKLVNASAEMRDPQAFAEPSAARGTPKVNADVEKESGAIRAGLGRPNENALEGPSAAEPVEPRIAVQPDRMGPGEGYRWATNGASPRTEAIVRPTAKNTAGRAQDGYAVTKPSAERHLVAALAQPMAVEPTGALTPMRTMLDANPNETNTDEATKEPALAEGFGSTSVPRAFLPGPPTPVQSPGRRDAPVKGSTEEAEAPLPTGTLAPRIGPRQRQTTADERPSTRSNPKLLASPEDVSVPFGGTGVERAMPDAITGTSSIDVHRQSGVKPMTVDGAPLRSTDEANAAVRVAEVAGHRRALASEAHGAVTLEHVGRFEVRARPHDGGRVEVQVQAEHKAGSAMLGAHAEDLRADLRAAIPHATIDVTTSGAAGSSDGRERSAGGDTARDSSDRPTAAPRHSSPADAEQPLAASWNRRNARVRIVL